MFNTSFYVTYCIYIPGKNRILLASWRSLWRVQISDTFWFEDRIRLFVHYIISLSSLCKLIWRHGTYKMSGIYILSSVWVRLSILPQLSILRYMGLCFLSLPIFLLMIESIYTLSYYLHRIGSMNYYPLFVVRSWNNGTCCMPRYVLIRMSLHADSTMDFENFISEIITTFHRVQIEPAASWPQQWEQIIWKMHASCSIIWHGLNTSVGMFSHISKLLRGIDLATVNLQQTWWYRIIGAYQESCRILAINNDHDLDHEWQMWLQKSCSGY